MLENVKKCKNFLAMLIKLACSGSQSPEMGQNVKKLVGQLLVRQCDETLRAPGDSIESL